MRHRDETAPHNLGRCRLFRWVVLTAFCVLNIASVGFAQIRVDCTGADTTAYPTINAALNATPTMGGTIVINGPCTENVWLSHFYNLNLGAAIGKTATLNGTLNVSLASNVYLYGLNVTNANGTGISISESHGVTLENCSSSGNSGDGLGVGSMADVMLMGTASFNDNQQYGINAGTHAVVILGWGSGPISVSDNGRAGIWLTQQSTLNGLGNLTVERNGAGATPNPASVSGYGIEIYGASVVQLGDCTASNTIKDNVSGGVSVQENSQYSQWDCSSQYANLIQSNGPVGVTVALSGQATLNAVQITGHKGPAISVESGSSFFGSGTNVFSNNGDFGVSDGAAISLSGNSHALLEGGQISSTPGPAIAANLGSTVDFSKVVFAGNAGGIIQCDSSSYMWTDLARSRQQALGCTVPSTPIVHGAHPMHFAKPDITALRNRQAAYRRAASGAAHPGAEDSKPVKESPAIAIPQSQTRDR